MSEKNAVTNTGEGDVQGKSFNPHTIPFAERYPFLAQYEHLSTIGVLNALAERIKRLEDVAELDGWMLNDLPPKKP